MNAAILSATPPRGALRAMEKGGLITVMVLLGLGVTLLAVVMVVAVVLAANGMTFLSLPSSTSPEGPNLLGSNVTDATFDSFSMTVHGVSISAMTPWIFTLILGCLVLAATLVFFLVLALRLYRGRPFGRLITAGLATIAVVNIAGAFVFPALFSVASRSILVDLGIPLDGAPFKVGYLFTEADMASLVVGVICALFAGAFHIGTRLQRETEGLV
ncbi:hypothetical protein [Arthrobacter sp.]|uniref:hypothetical protein n=1 Tax=Arthrobacter sp. TaxID=1667 RepID=UPI002811AF00|nr:hypothetical protein [Arthrobacter sp.]